MRKLPYLLLALLVYLLAPASPLFAQTEPTPLSLADYQARLTRITQTLETTDDQAAALRAAQAELAAIQQVRLASGQVVPVQSLLQLNDADQPTPTIALTRLHLVLDQLAAAPNDQTATRLAQLDAVFARHEFNTPQSLWQRFIRWLRSRLPDVEISPGGGENGDVVVSFVGYGVNVWRPTTDWVRLHDTDATTLARNANGSVAAAFVGGGVGRYTPTGGWESLHTGTPAASVAMDLYGNVFATLGGFGVYEFNPFAGWRLRSASTAGILSVG